MRFAHHHETIVRSISNAKGKVTISFDGWKANNNVLDFLGVVLHYLGDDYKLHNVVLEMRDILGCGLRQHPLRSTSACSVLLAT
jgi:hypothetical protein